MAENKLPSIKSLLIFVIVLFALITALIMAIDFPSFKNYPPVTIQSTVEPTPVVDISDWKTYRNEKYGYEFKYPSNIFLNSYDEVGNEIEIANNAITVATQYNNKKGVIFFVRDVNISLTPDGIKNQFGATNKENISIIPAQIAGVNGYQVVFADNKNIVSDFYFIKKGEQVLELTVLKNDKIVSKMLSTFKFIK
ncbi:MAG: PsbP-related protein [bacterium]|nr:PsbP-related protein [bacterium]